MSLDQWHQTKQAKCAPMYRQAHRWEESLSPALAPNCSILPPWALAGMGQERSSHKTVNAASRTSAPRELKACWGNGGVEKVEEKRAGQRVLNQALAESRERLSPNMEGFCLSFSHAGPSPRALLSRGLGHTETARLLSPPVNTGQEEPAGSLRA